MDSPLPAPPRAWRIWIDIGGTFTDAWRWIRLGRSAAPRCMRELLRYAVARGVAGAYGRRLLAAFEAPARLATSPEQPDATRTDHKLTPREVEILRLVAAGMRNQAIATHLFISPSTVKRHIANLYGKLGVSHRTEALVRAGELGLL